MANPQKENGHLDVANEIVEKLSKTPFSGSEFRIILSVLRKTWAWHKKEDRISLTQIAKATELPRRSVRRTRDGLVEQNVLLKNPGGVKNAHRAITIYMFNKDFDTWRVRVKNAHRVKRVKNAHRAMRKNAHHKRKETKETLSRKFLKAEFFDLVDLLSEKMKRNDPLAKTPKTEKQREKWANEFRLLVEKDKRPIEEIKGVLEWSQGDSFWKGNILSPAKLREKYPQLRLKMLEKQDEQGKRESFSDAEHADYIRKQKEALKK